jgi:8-oxo-dGTP diphosphatase
MNGDGFVTLADGSARWGLFGAAGILVRCRDRYFVALRSPYSHQGGTWAIPGGARHSDETPLEGALREFREEVSVALDEFVVAAEHEDDHGGWSYWTIVVDVDEPFEVPEDVHWETSATAWMTTEELARADLLPAFRSTLVGLGVL